MKTKFYPTITSVSGNHFKKIKEAKKLKISKLCVFFSPLNLEERKDIYKALEQSHIEEIIFAHIRGDYTKEEIYYLKKRFGTKLFNFHSVNNHPILYDHEELKKEIYIENTVCEFTDEEIRDYAGICLDVSHLENDRLTNNKSYNYFLNLLNKMKCGCGHASAIKNKKEYCPVAEKEKFDKHTFNELKDFDYLKKYKKLLPSIIALEVENSLKEQLNAIKYINNLLGI